MEELSYVLTQYFVSSVHLRFCFSLPLIFTLLAASISHSLTAALKFHVFLPTTFVSFVFSHSLQLFLCYPRECKQQNNVEKDETLLLFFLSKSPGGHSISFQIKPWVAFRLPYLLIELFYIGNHVVPTDSRAVGRCTVTWLSNFLGWVVYHIFLPMMLRCTRESSAITSQFLENEPLAKLRAIWVKKAEARCLRPIS